MENTNMEISLLLLSILNNGLSFVYITDRKILGSFTVCGNFYI